MSDRYRRMLMYVGLPLLLSVAFEYWPSDTLTPAPAATEGSVEAAEKRLAILRDIAATVPAKEEILKKVTAELATREKGLINAATAPQAQAQVVTVLRRLLNQEGVEIRNTEVGAVSPLGDRYGSAAIAVQFDCQIAQLVNVLAGLETQPELISTRDFQIRGSNPKEKTVQVRLTVAGVVPGSLVPDRNKKGVAGF
ncbi:MAG: type II secretion system protein GspM [Acidobacteriota bacterium]